jgi:hypothetical protein
MPQIVATERTTKRLPERFMSCLRVCITRRRHLPDATPSAGMLVRQNGLFQRIRRAADRKTSAPLAMGWTNAGLVLGKGSGKKRFLLRDLHHYRLESGVV